MFCSKCGNQSDDVERFCRKCGTDLSNAPLATAKQNTMLQRVSACDFNQALAKDPDEMTGNGIGGIFVGDGFFMVAVILSATNTSISSLLWLLLLIPAFYFFGRGFAELLKARQIRLRLAQNHVNNAAVSAELPPPRMSVVDFIKSSGKLAAASRARDRTTRELN